MSKPNLVKLANEQIKRKPNPKLAKLKNDHVKRKYKVRLHKAHCHTSFIILIVTIYLSPLIVIRSVIIRE